LSSFLLKIKLGLASKSPCWDNYENCGKLAGFTVKKYFQFILIGFGAKHRTNYSSFVMVKNLIYLCLSVRLSVCFFFLSHSHPVSVYLFMPKPLTRNITRPSINPLENSKCKENYLTQFLMKIKLFNMYHCDLFQFSELGTKCIAIANKCPKPSMPLHDIPMSVCLLSVCEALQITGRQSGRYVFRF
jgi:hypothetical protein